MYVFIPFPFWIDDTGLSTLEAIHTGSPLVATFSPACVCDNHLCGENIVWTSVPLAFSRRALSVWKIFLPVNLDNFASFLVLAHPCMKLQSVILTDGHGLGSALLPQHFEKRRQNFPEKWGGAFAGFYFDQRP